MSTILIGWRQNISLQSAEVESISANSLVKNNFFLSLLALGIATGFVIVCNLLVFGYAVSVEFRNYKQKTDVFNFLRQSFAPVRKYLTDESEILLKRTPTNELIEGYERINRLEYRKIGTLPHDELVRDLGTSPLQVRNAIIGDEIHRILDNDRGVIEFWHSMVLLAEHISILPLLSCAVIALIQVH